MKYFTSLSLKTKMSLIFALMFVSALVYTYLGGYLQSLVHGHTIVKESFPIVLMALPWGALVLYLIHLRRIYGQKKVNDALALMAVSVGSIFGVIGLAIYRFFEIRMDRIEAEIEARQE